MTQIFSPKQIELLETATRADPCGLAIRLMVRMGLRHGEVLELRSGDYDFDARTLAIRGLNPRLMVVPEELRFPMMRQVQGRRAESYLISMRPDGSRRLGDRTFQAYLARAGRELGLRGLTAHSLRVTHIVRRLEAGIDPKLIQAELGARSSKSIHKYRSFARNRFELAADDECRDDPARLVAL